jgi:hypothetical protein
MYDTYHDKWKKFIKRCIRNIDYLSYGVAERIVEEIVYMFELTTLKEEDYLFHVGTPCNNIYIISNGELNIYVHNNSKENFVETLYTGCIIGAYGSLSCDDYSISGKAKTDLTLLRLPFARMQALRDTYEDLDKVMSEYQVYIEDNGLPYCDYKLYRTKHLNMTPLEKFQYGVKRIMRIVRSYKSSTFHDLMEKVRDKIKGDKDKRESRKRSAIMRVPFTPEERTQQILIDLVGKVESLNDKVDNQEKLIFDMRKDLTHKIIQLK